MTKKIIIIGGGIAGLSTGIYAQMNGFNTQILEMHNIAGGQCTAWNRKGYQFDYCLHWLVGTRDGAFNRIWKETGVIDETVKIHDHDIHTCIVNENGDEFNIYTDINRWEKYLLEIAPEDEKGIKKMCSEMRKGTKLEPFDDSPETRSKMAYFHFLKKSFPLFMMMLRYRNKSFKDYVSELNFENPKLKSFFDKLYGESDFSAFAFIMMLAWFHNKNAGYLMGGSKPLAQRMVNKYKASGGTILYGKKVVKILINNNTAIGVELADNTKIYADYVISAADGHATIFDMLDGRYISKKFKNAYENWEVFTPLVQVSFGISKKLEDKGTKSYLMNGIFIGSTLLTTGYTIMDYSFDSSMAPDGKTTLVLRYESPWQLWENMLPEDYIKEKEKIRKDCVEVLEKHYPGISFHIEVIDIATPKTTVKYTGVWKGAYEGFLPSSKVMMKSLKMKLPGLRHFYMVGQWLYPGGGLPPSAQSGKWLIQNICKKEKLTFTTKIVE